MRKLHKHFGRIIYRWLKEPKSGNLTTQPNKNLYATEIVRRIPGLHYYS